MNSALLGWFATSGRDLDVRATTDPWPTLVAEVMSHQTQIARVGGPWRAFVERWPSAQALADAATNELLVAWAGLGYNRRALALRAAARQIVKLHGGVVPGDIDSLEQLPGIGPYTARAVLATAFGHPVAPLDVNVRRVVERLLGPAAADTGLQAGADALVAADDPRRWVHAVMDLATGTCTRRSPACARCPVARWCRSRGTAGDASSTRSSRPRSPESRFESTNRWLRGRVVVRLREAGAGHWIDFGEPIGDHPVEAVHRALLGLAEDGFLELDGGRARLI